MKFSDLPDEWKEKFSAKYPEGRPCRLCGKSRGLEDCGFSKNGQGRYVLDRFCPSCRRNDWNQRRRFGAAGIRYLTPFEEAEESRVLPVLVVGRKYEVGGECTGRVVARQGPHYVLRTQSGTRCYTTGQLVGMEIREA